MKVRASVSGFVTSARSFGAAAWCGSSFQSEAQSSGKAEDERWIRGMARIAGVDLPRTKRVEIGLTYIFGIGRVRSNKILTDAGVSADIRVKDLSEDHAGRSAGSSRSRAGSRATSARNSR